MKILHFSLTEGYIKGFEKYIKKYCKENNYKIDFIDNIEKFDELKDINKYNKIICAGYDELNLIFNKNYNNKIIVLDYHMLKNFPKYGNKLAEKIKNHKNIEIHSPFIKFLKEYHSFFKNFDRIETGNFLSKIKWGYLPTDIDYINDLLINKSKNDYIMVPGNHRRDYELLFKSIKIVEEKNIFYKYKIYDHSIDNNKITKCIEKYNIKSEIFYNGNIKYDNFLNEIYNSKFVILSLENKESICNGLTVYNLALACSKLTIVNNNKTISPFTKNGYNCLIGENENDLAKYIIYAIKNDDICRKIGNNAKKYIQNNCSFKRIISEFM